MVNSSSSKSTRSQGKSTKTAFKVGPPAKKPVAVSIANAKKTKQESIKKHARQDENAKPVQNDAGLHAQYAAKLKKLEAENYALRKAATAQPMGLPSIPRPERGVAGNGFNLRAAMELEEDHMLYCTVRRCIRSLVDRAGLDYTVPWYSQPKETVGKIIGAARERHAFLNRFPNGWPVEEFIKTYLKNKRAYARKQGYLTENSNQKQDRSDDDDDEEEEEEEEQEEQGQGQEQEQEMGKGGETEEDNRHDGGIAWNRGNGWNKDHSGPEEDNNDDMY